MHGETSQQKGWREREIDEERIERMEKHFISILWKLQEEEDKKN